jgi:hypothetical protein
MPMVWGVSRWRLLLPEEASRWPAQRLRAVLLHELSHLRRGDPFALVVAHLALALHWINPLAWMAVRAMRNEQEQACDDAVLRNGVRPSDYASDMLELTNRLPFSSVPSGALTIANTGGIEDRVTAILDSSRNRRPVNRWAGVVIATVATVVAAPLSMLQASADGDEEPTTVVNSPDPAESVPFNDVLAELDKPTGLRFASDISRRRLGLLRQLAALDPERVLALEGEGPVYESWMLPAAAYKEFGKRGEQSLEELLERVNAFHSVEHRDIAAVNLIKGASHRDPQGALKLLPRLRIRAELRTQIVEAAFDELIEHNAAAAGKILTEGATPRIVPRLTIIESIASTWGAAELDAALIWARSLGALNERVRARRGAIRAFAKAHPDRVIQKLSSLIEPGRSQNAWIESTTELQLEIVEIIAPDLGRWNPNAALAWARDVSSGQASPIELKATTKQSTEDRLQYGLSLPEGSKRRVELMDALSREIAKDDPTWAMELSKELPTRRRVRFNSEIGQKGGQRRILKQPCSSSRQIHASTKETQIS